MRNDTQVNFRMPTDLKAKLQSAASENERSLTAEIVERLERSLLGETADRVGTRYLADLLGGLRGVDDLAEKLGLESRTEALDLAQHVIEVSGRIAFPIHLTTMAMSRLPTIADEHADDDGYASGLSPEQAADIMRDLATFQLRLTELLGKAIIDSKNASLTKADREAARREVNDEIERMKKAIISFANDTGLVEGYQFQPKPDAGEAQ